MDAWKSEEKAEGLDHRMGRIRQGSAHCMHEDCSAAVTFSGSLSLSDLWAEGTALTERCPYRG